jgi:hypothetical protein
VDCILRVGNAGEGEQASVIGLLSYRSPALEGIYHHTAYTLLTNGVRTIIPLRGSLPYPAPARASR